jgi:ABC-type bacteriocin/lantibiotic exporter with double-glycine peptidase domain
MNSQQIVQILLEYQRIFDQRGGEVGPGSFEWDRKEYASEEVSAFIHDLTAVGNRHQLIFLQNDIPAADLEVYLTDLAFPVLLFQREQEEWVPVSVYAYTRKNSLILKYYGDSKRELSSLPPIDDLLKDQNGKVVTLATFQFNSLVSEEEEESGPVKKLTPVQRLFRIFSAERRDITYIYLYAVFIGLISLVPPLGVQGIISQISGGVEISTIWILIGVVILAVLFSGVLQIMQLLIVEILQRRVFTKAAYEFAFRIPRLKVEAIQKHYAPELINRFFDVISVQKGLPKLLLDVSSAALQILFGLILLSFYHYVFIVFGIVLLMVLGFIFYFTGPKGLQSSLDTSKYKYKVVYWLEELARTMDSFKMAGNTPLPVRRADQNLNSYLKYRQKHFKVLLSQYIYMHLFRVIVIGGLLIIGSILVIDRQITLGQFVASELVVVLIVGSVEKIVMYVDAIYDTLTAVEKIGNVTDLPLERSGGVRISELVSGGLHVKTRDLKYKYAGSSQWTLQGVDLDIAVGEKVVITGPNGSGKSTLINILSGIYTGFEGLAAYNNVPLRDISLMDLRATIAKNISQEDIFDGTFLENITVGLPNSGYANALAAAGKVKLLDVIQAVPKGLHTEITSAGKDFSDSIVHKIILARCIAKNPKLLILNDFFKIFDDKEKRELLEVVTQEGDWTLITVSNDPVVHSYCDRVILLENGRVKL